MPLVFIGVPTFNGEDYLADTLESLRIQNYQNILVLISDNFSSDRTSEIVQHFCEIDSRFTYVRQGKNIGPKANFDFLLQNRRGKYFLWVACDDPVEKNFILEKVRFLEGNEKISAVMSDVTEIDKNGRILRDIEIDFANFPFHVSRLYMLRKFFRTPISNVYFFIYSMFRSDALGAAKIDGFGANVASGSEVGFLAGLSTKLYFAKYGSSRKLYRKHDKSVYETEAANTSIFNNLKNKVLVWRDLAIILHGSDLPAWTKSYILILGISEFIIFLLKKLVVTFLFRENKNGS